MKLLLVLSVCFAVSAAYPNLVDLAQANGATKLVELLTSAGLADILRDPTQGTLTPGNLLVLLTRLISQNLNKYLILVRYSINCIYIYVNVAYFGLKIDICYWMLFCVLFMTLFKTFMYLKNFQMFSSSSLLVIDLIGKCWIKHKYWACFRYLSW